MIIYAYTLYRSTRVLLDQKKKKIENQEAICFQSTYIHRTYIHTNTSRHIIITIILCRNIKLRSDDRYGEMEQEVGCLLTCREKSSGPYQNVRDATCRGALYIYIYIYMSTSYTRVTNGNRVRVLFTRS
jgi:hypothetical protein